MSFEYSDVDQVLFRYIENLLDAMRVYGPPVDALEVMRMLNIEFAINRLGPRGYLRYVDERPVASLRSEMIAERTNWSAAHEVAEHLMPDLQGLVGEDLCPWQKEKLGRRFASLLLVPQHWFPSDCRETKWNLYDLKDRYSTASNEVLASRWLDVSDSPMVVRVFDKGENRRRPWQPSKMPPLFEVERIAQREANHTGSVVRAAAENVEAIAWPVHDPETGWKREIVRTTVSFW